MSGFDSLELGASMDILIAYFILEKFAYKTSMTDLIERALLAMQINKTSLANSVSAG